MKQEDTNINIGDKVLFLRKGKIGIVVKIAMQLYKPRAYLVKFRFGSSWVSEEDLYKIINK